MVILRRPPDLYNLNSYSGKTASLYTKDPWLKILKLNWGIGCVKRIRPVTYDYNAMIDVVHALFAGHIPNKNMIIFHDAVKSVIFIGILFSHFFTNRSILGSNEPSHVHQDNINSDYIHLIYAYRHR